MSDLDWIAKWQTQEVAGLRCALCGREYGDADYEAGSDLRYVGTVAQPSLSVHDECFNGFTRLCDLYGFPWRSMIGQRNDRPID